MRRSAAATWPLDVTELHTAARNGASDAEHADRWRIVQSSDATSGTRYAALFCLANGILGVRAGAEEAPAASDGSFLADAWERRPIHYHERYSGFPVATQTRVPVADATRIAINVHEGGAPHASAQVHDSGAPHASAQVHDSGAPHASAQVPASGAPNGHARIDGGDVLHACAPVERMLDLRTGVVMRRQRYRTAAGATLEVLAERIAPFDAGALHAIRWRVTSIDFTGSLTLDSMIDGRRGGAAQGDDPRIGSGRGGGLDHRQSGAAGACTFLVQTTRAADLTVACAQRHRIVEGATEHGVQHADENRAGTRFQVDLEPGGNATIEKFVAYACTHAAASEVAPLCEALWPMLDHAAEVGFSGWLTRQRHTLDTYWSAVDLAIDGDAESERVLRLNLFHLFQSTGRDGLASAAAKGLTGEGYEGHYFWDAEAFVLPVFALTAPALARGMLDYRYRTLDRARAHAREMDQARGALYAWRTISGDECSAYFPSGSAQYHINAAIAFAIRLYVEASGDEAFLRERGAEMLFETARIWLEIGHFNPRRGGAFCIAAVTGPDEYSTLVDNNFYTNRMAQQHLHYAVSVARMLQAEAPAAAAAVAARIGLDADEIARWAAAADAMYLPRDEQLGIYAQDDAFLDKPAWDFAATPADRHPLLLHYHPLTLSRHQVCKQADVVLALVLAGEPFHRDEKRRNFDYYEAITVHDSTLSASTFSVLASEVGHHDKAWAYFLASARVDVDDLHGNTDHGMHMAAMAGSWLSLVWGFGGLRVIEGQLSFAPVLPAAWRGYRFGLVWRGRRLHVSVAGDGVRYSVIEGEPLAILHAGTRVLVGRGSAANGTAWPVQRAAARSSSAHGFPRPLQALIFDLDGVLTDTARLHYLAWKQLADEIDVAFDERINERLKGIDRAGSLEIVLESAPQRFSIDEKREFAARKNRYYVAALEQLGPQHLLPGAREALVAARARGLKLGLASVSRNAGAVIARLGIAALFDYVADAATLARSKPDPEIFLQVARALKVAPDACLGIEDAAAGVAAIKAAGMTALGIGDPRALAGADLVLRGLAEFDLDFFSSPQPPRDALAAEVSPMRQRRFQPGATAPHEGGEK